MTADTMSALARTGPFATLAAALSRIEVTDFAGEAVSLLEADSRLYRRLQFIRDQGGRLIFIGNGGSAAIAAHMAQDWQKLLGFPTLLFNDASSLTALANDNGYERVFADPIMRHGRPNDVLFAISSSGASPNILAAVDEAMKRSMAVVSLSGFAPDNPLRRKGVLNYWVPSRAYGTVEVAHHAILHSLLDTTAERILVGNV